jgi:hypothetical protein
MKVRKTITLLLITVLSFALLPRYILPVYITAATLENAPPPQLKWQNNPQCCLYYKISESESKFSDYQFF